MAGDFGFDGRVIAITGAGRGIGRAHALLLAKLGARVVVNDLGSGVTIGSGESAAPANAVVDEILASGGDAVASFADISRPEGAHAVIEAALDTFGRIDAVINNAGTSVHKPFEQVTSDELGAMRRLHIGGHFYVTQAAWPHLVRQGYGRVVMTASGSGLFGSSENHHYAAAKAGVVGLTRSLAIDAAPHGITVNVIAPLAATRLADNITDAAMAAAFAKAMRVDQIAPLVAWLAHERCSVNGEIFEVGGGLAARVLIAEGRGYFAPDHDIAAIEAHLAEIMDERDYALPRSGEETAYHLLKRTRAKL